ncbi:MAG: orotidine-5'-phosphate decarboxylase [Pseudanabaenaceae cyanobacterium bins.68]|nr:orotidine-5'-phosphate decarboxylase [Pseudanabaenaceae cyanobacterium bins.68]
MGADRIIVALDVASMDLALAWCDRLPEVQFWKVGLELFTAVGREVVWELKQRHKRVFLDLKLHDIPHTVAKTCERLADLGVDFVTVHSCGGKDMITAATQALAGSHTQVVAVSLLTSIASTQLVAELQINLPLANYVAEMASLAEQSGAQGIVCSPQEIALLRSHLKPQTLLVTPGIRLASDQLDDQKRVMTPKQAITLGADYLVIGRSILAAADPQQAWQQCQIALRDS